MEAPAPQNVYYVQGQGNVPDIAKWMESWDEDFIYLFHYLNGETYDPSSPQAWRKIGEVIINDKGQQALVLLLFPILNKNTWMRKLTEERVHKLTHELTDSITGALYLNWKTWGVKPEMFDAMVELFMHAIESAYSRAQDGGEREWLKKSVQETHNISSNPQEKKGWLPFNLLPKKG